MVIRWLQAERRTESVRWPKTGVLPTVLRNQPTGVGLATYRSRVRVLPRPIFKISQKCCISDVCTIYYFVERLYSVVFLCVCCLGPRLPRSQHLWIRLFLYNSLCFCLTVTVLLHMRKSDCWYFASMGKLSSKQQRHAAGWYTDQQQQQSQVIHNIEAYKRLWTKLWLNEKIFKTHIVMLKLF